VRCIGTLCDLAEGHPLLGDLAAGHRRHDLDCQADYSPGLWTAMDENPWLTDPDEWPIERKFAVVCGLAVIVFCVCVVFILWFGLP
jgi:hypothetical protein